MKKIKHLRIAFLIMVLGALNLSACTSSVNDTKLATASAEIKTKQTESDQMRWHVYISDDMPEYFIEVLMQYESFINAESPDLNDESVRSRLEGGEWRYLYMELCGYWQSTLERKGVIAADEFCYSLVDLTGDGELELVIGQGDNPCVIYYYSDEDEIKMECTSSYFTMTLYEGGVIEYISGGVDYTTTYLLFSENTESWEPKTEIEARYIAEPLQLEWLPLLAENPSSEKYLTDMGLHPLYVDFLQGKLSVTYSYTYEGKQHDVECDFYADKDYAEEHVFESAFKRFSLVDVNNDNKQELIFMIDDGLDKLMYIIGVGKSNELICYDIFETHTSHMSFGVQNNGFVYWDQCYTGAEVELYTYDINGEIQEVIHFIKEPDSETDLSYDYYYLNGNKEAKHYLQSDKEYEEIKSDFYDERPIWYECEAFVDVPK